MARGGARLQPAHHLQKMCLGSTPVALDQKFGDDKDEYRAYSANVQERRTTAISKDLFEDQAQKNEQTFRGAIDLFNNR